jgi:L,D-peptidoglycan transpeptidase YkuD (ErfK/YbiS/YcfS/YnhG family)
MNYKLGALLVVLASTTTLMFYFKPDIQIKDECQALVTSASVPAPTSQVIVVKSAGGFKAEITACQKKGASWKRAVSAPFPAVVGKEGMVPAEEKKEGDLKTPTGLYRLGEAFGTHPLAIKMDYKYITADDKFIDDVTSEFYNSWVNGQTDVKSYESMLIAPYEMGVVINYNMKPAISGKGSAIFMHISKSLKVPTYGCVAMDEYHLFALLRWLDKKHHPYIYIVPAAL